MMSIFGSILAFVGGAAALRPKTNADLNETRAEAAAAKEISGLKIRIGELMAISTMQETRLIELSDQKRAALTDRDGFRLQVNMLASENAGLRRRLAVYEGQTTQALNQQQAQAQLFLNNTVSDLVRNKQPQQGLMGHFESFMGLCNCAPARSDVLRGQIDTTRV